MTFYITIHHHRKEIKLKAELIYQDELTERYAVIEGENEYVFERTKPVFRHVALKLQSSWRLLKPKTLYGTIKSEIIHALTKEVE